MKDWIKEEPPLAGALLAAILGVIALSVWGWQLKAGNQRLVRQLIGQVRVWNDLAVRSPAPTEANIATASLHLADLEAQSRRLRRGLEAQGSWDRVPAFRGLEEVYFDLVGMVEKQRSAFQSAGIGLAGDEQFGYGQIIRAQQVASTSEDAADTEQWIQRLHRQRQAIDAVLTALLQAAPSALLGVDRSPLQFVDPALIERTEDFFLIYPAVTAAVPDSIETYGLRIRFEGKTAVLRAFLEELRIARRPLVVRSIEVEPVASDSAARRSARPNVNNGSPFARLRVHRSEESREDAASVPIVANNDSVFVVVLEGFALLNASGMATASEEGDP